MLYSHKKTGKVREFVQGMDIHEDWSPIQTEKTGAGVLSISEVDPKAITTIKAQKAAKTRAKNKAAKEKAGESK